MRSVTWKTRTMTAILPGLLLWLAVGTPLSAESVVERWYERLDAAERDLEAEKWYAAYRKAEKVSRDVMRRLEGGTRAEELLARTLFIQAVAEAGRGNERLAHWNWNAALRLHPPMAERSLERYGAAGALLRKPREDLSGGATANEEDLEGVTGEDIQSPRGVDMPKPEYPDGRRGLEERVEIIVKTIVGREGRLWAARVLNEEEVNEPLFKYAIFRAMRDWKLEPATFEGEPIAVYYNFTIRFSPP